VPPSAIGMCERTAVRRIVLAMCLATTALPGVASADVDSARIEAARKAALTDSYQPTLPGGEGSGATADDAGHPRGTRDVNVVDTRDTQDQDHGAMGGMFAIIMWGVIIVGVVLLIVWIGAELMKYGGDDSAIAQDAAVPAAPDLAVIDRPLGDAEELARRGEFREAIHTLLLRTLEELARTASVRVAPAMTSREILGRVPLLADSRDALAGLITAVELTHFGGDEATEHDYVRCRAQFQVFATAFRGTA
jgi:hypothetical protein